MTSLFLMTSSFLSHDVSISKNPRKPTNTDNTSLFFGRKLAMYNLFGMTSRKCIHEKLPCLYQHFFFCWCQQKLKLQFLATGSCCGHENWTHNSICPSLHATIKKFHINAKICWHQQFFDKFENWWRHHVMTSSW